MFDQMYELNLKYYKELTMYILAGKKRLEDVYKRQDCILYMILYFVLLLFVLYWPSLV